MNGKQQRRAEVLAKISGGAISKTDAERLLGFGRGRGDHASLRGGGGSVEES